MGIFGFYSSLVKKYPKVVTNAIQEPTTDATSPNPNGFEFDNLYLDMNGIIHPCFHPDDLDEVHPTSFEEVFTSVFEYVDRLFNIVRPRKLLYLAIDGVAPMAKFSGISEKKEKLRASTMVKLNLDALRKEYIREGNKLVPKAKKTQVDDPCNIAPGTEFMYELSKALQVLIQTRLKENPAWKNLKVILSDANVPGEGEHKIVCFMRSQRNQPGYDVNTRHCIHGLDADLIMLALATHELHISILREFVQIWILKEYIELEMQASDAPEDFKFDVERAVDDFILICFLLGNDFIPCLPSLDVREGALDLLMIVYKEKFKSLGGYLVDSAQINEPNGAYLSLERLEKFVLFLGSYEDQILQKRNRLLKSKMSRREENQPLASRNDGARDMETPVDITNAEDEIKYGSAGWKDRYYHENFPHHNELELDSIIKGVVEEYTEGLCWVLLYYFSGVPSWTWIYHYYDGPCASDFKGIAQKRVEFEEGVPLKPFDLLKAVLPSRSRGLLPRPFRKLKFYARMRREYAAFMNDGINDLIPSYSHATAVEELTINDLYLPLCFIGNGFLITNNNLQEYETQRNSLNTDALFVRALSDFGSQLESNKVDDSSTINEVGGFIDLILHALDSSNEEDRILCVHFSLPKLGAQASGILDNVDYPPKTVYESDIKETTLWHEHNSPFQYYRVLNQKRCSGIQENEASGSSGLLNSREGLYNPPNLKSQTTRSSNSSVSSTPQAQAMRGRGQFGHGRGSGSSQRW